MVKNWFKRKTDEIGDWLTDPYPGYVSNADAYIGSFFSGAGLYFWCWMIVVGIYCVLTGKKLDFVKR